MVGRAPSRKTRHAPPAEAAAACTWGRRLTLDPDDARAHADREHDEPAFGRKVEVSYQRAPAGQIGHFKVEPEQ
jgi:nitrogen fixation protein FixH